MTVAVKRVGVLLRLEPEVLERVDVARGVLGRNAWLRLAVESFLQPSFPGGTRETQSDLALGSPDTAAIAEEVGVGASSEFSEDTPQTQRTVPHAPADEPESKIAPSSSSAIGEGGITPDDLSSSRPEQRTPSSLAGADTADITPQEGAQQGSEHAPSIPFASNAPWYDEELYGA